MDRTSSIRLMKLCERIKTAPVYEVNGYKYFVWPFKGISPIDPGELESILFLFENMVKEDIGDDFSTIFTLMTDGEVVAVPLALKLNKKLIIARDYHYNQEFMHCFTQKTGYFERDMYFGGLTASDRIVIVDVILSTGGTIAGLIPALKKAGCKVCGIYTLINKIGNGGAKRLESMGLRYRWLLNLDIRGHRIYVTPSSQKGIIDDK